MDFKIDNNSLEEYKNFISKFYKMDIYNVREYNSIELIEGMGENLLYSILNFNLDVLVEGYLGSFNQYKGDYSFNSYLVALVNFFFREKDLIIEELEEEDINSIVDYRVDMDLEEFLRVSIDLYFKNLVGGVELVRLKNYINNLEERISYLEKSEKKLLNSFKEVDFNNPDIKKDYFYKLGRLSYRKSKLEVRRENLIKELKTLESLR